MKIAREFWAYPVPPKHGAVSAYTHKELCPDPNPIHLREVLPDDIQDLDELEKELLDKLYHATREVDEVKYKLGHKIEVLIGLVDFLKSGIEHFTHEEEGTTDSTMSIFLVWSAVGLQIFGITLLYNGVIK